MISPMRQQTLTIPQTILNYIDIETKQAHPKQTQSILKELPNTIPKASQNLHCLSHTHQTELGFAKGLFFLVPKVLHKSNHPKNKPKQDSNRLNTHTRLKRKKNNRLKQTKTNKQPNQTNQTKQTKH